jgi:hypothetical protein
MRASFILFLISGCIAIAKAPESRPSIVHQPAGQSWEGALYTSLDSRYYSEGRDALDGDSLWVNSAELAYGKFTGGM